MDQGKTCPCSTPPKLALDSFPSFSSSRRADSLGMATPPIRLPGAVPFRWEEAPGRPKQKPGQSDAGAGAGADRQLGPPPRLWASVSTIRDDNRDVVIDRSCFLMRRRPPAPGFLFSGRRRAIKNWDVGSEKSMSEDTPNSSTSSDLLRSLSSVSACSFYSNYGEEEVESKEVIMNEGKGEERKVSIFRFTRKRSLARVASYTASRSWASIFGRLKQTAVPCQMDPKV